jgi:hypothetical protein
MVKGETMGKVTIFINDEPIDTFSRKKEKEEFYSGVSSYIAEEVTSYRKMFTPLPTKMSTKSHCRSGRVRFIMKGGITL